MLALRLAVELLIACLGIGCDLPQDPRTTAYDFEFPPEHGPGAGPGVWPG